MSTTYFYHFSEEGGGGNLKVVHGAGGWEGVSPKEMMRDLMVGWGFRAIQ